MQKNSNYNTMRKSYEIPIMVDKCSTYSGKPNKPLARIMDVNKVTIRVIKAQNTLWGVGN